MQNLFYPLFLAGILFSCTSKKTAEQNTVPETTQKELETAEIKMFDAIKNYDSYYWETDVADDYVTIYADGVMMNKMETIADTAHRKMLSGGSYKLSDKKIRVYSDAGIINGKAQFFYQEKLMAEVFYTELWLKKDGKWFFNGWQGTFAKDSLSMPKQ